MSGWKEVKSKHERKVSQLSRYIKCHRNQVYLLVGIGLRIIEDGDLRTMQDGNKEERIKWKKEKCQWKE